MANVVIVRSLFEEIERKFKQESSQVFDFIETVANNPKKGKALGHVGPIVIKELRYRSFRFYFITDGHTLKAGSAEDIANLLIKFVRMSDKKEQQTVIDEIRAILTSLGFDGF